MGLQFGCHLEECGLPADGVWVGLGIFLDRPNQALQQHFVNLGFCTGHKTAVRGQIEPAINEKADEYMVKYNLPEIEVGVAEVVAVAPNDLLDTTQRLSAKHAPKQRGN